jgi:hypothetical protein
MNVRRSIRHDALDRLKSIAICDELLADKELATSSNVRSGFQTSGRVRTKSVDPPTAGSRRLHQHVGFVRIAKVDSLPTR